MVALGGGGLKWRHLTKYTRNCFAHGGNLSCAFNIKNTIRILGNIFLCENGHVKLATGFHNIDSYSSLIHYFISIGPSVLTSCQSIDC